MRERLSIPIGRKATKIDDSPKMKTEEREQQEEENWCNTYRILCKRHNNLDQLVDLFLNPPCKLMIRDTRERTVTI